MIADLFAVDIILPDQLHGAREDRNLRVTGVIFRAGGLRVVDAETEQDIDEYHARDRADQEATLHRHDGCMGELLPIIA